MKKISIIVPVYKVEKYLDTCVNSLVNQTQENIEIILVDDGSPDNCPKICDDWAKKDSRIKVIHKENGGLSDARNKALEIATGDYIGFVDSDDYVSLDMYKTLVELLEKNDADISICQYVRFTENDTPQFTNDNEIYTFDNNIEVLKCMFSDKLVANAVWDKLYKKEIFDGIRFPVGMNYEDSYTTYKLILKANKFAITTSKFYGYMQRSNSIMATYSLKGLKNLMEVINTRYDDLKNIDELLYYLNISKLKYIYIFHAWAAALRDKEIYNSEELVNEYKFFKKTINLKNFKGYLNSGDLPYKIFKIIFAFDRKLFWMLKTRKILRKNKNKRKEIKDENQHYNTSI